MVTIDFDTIIKTVFGIIKVGIGPVIGYILRFLKEKNDLNKQRYKAAVTLLSEIDSLGSKITILHEHIKNVTVGAPNMLGTIAKSAGLDESSTLYSKHGMYYKFKKKIKTFDSETMINTLTFYIHVVEANKSLIRYFKLPHSPHSEEVWVTDHSRYSELDAFKREIMEAHALLPKVKSSLSEIIEEYHKRQWWRFW